jgi:hypothetical protein
MKATHPSLHLTIKTLDYYIWYEDFRCLSLTGIYAH